MINQNTIALVTGASRGIGRATAKALAESGAHVLLAARNEEQLNSLQHEIGDRAIPVCCDVSRYSDLAAAIDLCRDRFGRLDILVNNAGIIDPISRLEDSDPDAWSRAIDINLKGVYHGIRAAAPLDA